MVPYGSVQLCTSTLASASPSGLKESISKSGWKHRILVVPLLLLSSPPPPSPSTPLGSPNPCPDRSPLHPDLPPPYPLPTSCATLVEAGHSGSAVQLSIWCIGASTACFHGSHSGPSADGMHVPLADGAHSICYSFTFYPAIPPRSFKVLKEASGHPQNVTPGILLPSAFLLQGSSL